MQRWVFRTGKSPATVLIITVGLCSLPCGMCNRQAYSILQALDNMRNTKRCCKSFCKLALHFCSCWGDLCAGVFGEMHCLSGGTVATFLDGQGHLTEGCTTEANHFFYGTTMQCFRWLLQARMMCKYDSKRCDTCPMVTFADMK